MTNEDPLALLALENPVSEYDLPAPGSREARALVERIVVDLERERRPARTHRAPRLLTRGLMTAAAAAAFAVAALSTLGGDGVLPGNGPETASAVERAAAVLAGAQDEILHTVSVVTRSDQAGERRSEAWELLAAPNDMRQVTGRGDVTREISTVDRRAEVYLSSTDTISTL